MAASVNAHSLFAGRDQATFLKAITPSDAKRDQLLEARKRIRTYLKDCFFKLSQDVAKQQNLGLIDRLTAKPLRLSPKFSSQGSFVYGTLNRPAHQPPQEIDLDDGMYFPLEVLGRVPPKVASNLLFKVVGDMLENLCSVTPDWKLERKSTCCRISLPFGAHIDVPLYAYPEEYEACLETAVNFALGKAFSAMDAAQQKSLDSDKVWLAHRDNGWQQSDPKKIKDWFEGRVDLHGEQLRRVCRYLKAWRDQHFPTGGVPSIALMAHVVAIFDTTRMDSDRDDLALLRVAEKLPGLLSEKVKNPTIDVPEGDPSKYLDGSLEPKERDEVVQKATDLKQFLSEALEDHCQRQRTLKYLQLAFGPRLPDRPDLLHVDAAAEAVVTRFERSVLAPAIIPNHSHSA